MPRRITHISCDELRHLYEADGLSTTAIAERYGCSATTISYRLRYCGIPSRLGQFQPRGINLEELHRRYESDEPLSDIARDMGISKSTIHTYRRKLGWVSRSERGKSKKG